MTINKDFRTKSDQELIEIVKKLRTKLLEYRFRNSTGEFQKPHQIGYARKSLAQALTILRERKVDIAHLQMEKLSEINKSHSSYFKVGHDNLADKTANNKEENVHTDQTNTSKSTDGENK